MIIPYSDRVILKKYEAPKKTGIIIVPEEKELGRQLLAIVIKIGDKVDLDISEGDLIITDRYQCNEIKDLDGEEYLITKADYILAKVNA